MQLNYYSHFELLNYYLFIYLFINLTIYLAISHYLLMGVDVKESRVGASHQTEQVNPLCLNGHIFVHTHHCLVTRLSRSENKVGFLKCSELFRVQQRAWSKGSGWVRVKIRIRIREKKLNQRMIPSCGPQEHFLLKVSSPGRGCYKRLRTERRSDQISGRNHFKFFGNYSL